MSAEPFILCESLVKIYHLSQEGISGDTTLEVQALQGLDLTINPGEMIGIVGASGSGKSTLLNILGGLDRPTGGRALVAGQDLGRFTEAGLDVFRRQTVGFVWQHGARNLIPYLTATENVELPLTLSGQAGKASKARAHALLDLVGLHERAGHRLEELSGGEQQRVAVAIALANHPKLLLADEPTGELDTVTAKTIYDLLRKLNKELNITIIIVSHDPGIAQHVDRVVAVRDGKLASETVRVQKAEGEAHHLEELAVLDSAGRLQLPREYIERFGIKRRVKIEVTENGILIQPPGEHHSVERVAVAATEESAPPEAVAEKPGRWMKAREWLNGIGQRFTSSNKKNDDSPEGGAA